MHTALFCHVFLSCAKYFFLWEKLWKVFNMSISKEKVEVKAIVRVQKCHHTEKKVLLNCNRTLLNWKQCSSCLLNALFNSMRCTEHCTFYSNSDYFIRFKSFVAACHFKEGIGISISVWGDVNLSLSLVFFSVPFLLCLTYNLIWVLWV